MIDAQVMADCIARFAEEAAIQGVWGMGSAFEGRFRSDSDVDFAILYRRGCSPGPEQIGRLALELESILGRTVDMGCLSTQGLVYAYQAISRGKLLYCRDPAYVAEFVGRVLALYPDFKRDRKVVEEAYSVG